MKTEPQALLTLSIAALTVSMVALCVAIIAKNARSLPNELVTTEVKKLDSGIVIGGIYYPNSVSVKK